MKLENDFSKWREATIRIPITKNLNFTPTLYIRLICERPRKVSYDITIASIIRDTVLSG